jgi:hypothetical protein
MSRGQALRRKRQKRRRSTPSVTNRAEDNRGADQRAVGKVACARRE